jgi:hypothetical protein
MLTHAVFLELPRCHGFRIEPEETHSVELYLQTESKYVEWYEIYIAYVGPVMEP